MCDNEERCILGYELCEQALETLFVGSIEEAKRLIEDQELGLRG